MAYYHDKLKQLKNLGDIDFVKFNIGDAVATFRIVDDSDETVKLLSKWRDKYFDAFYDKFKVTEERTKIWVHKHVLDLPDRILFMIIINGQKVAHVGVYRYDEHDNSAELDNYLRGERGSYPGLMEKAELALLKLMFEYLKLSKAKVSMFSDNFKIVNLHASKIGCLAVGNRPFKRVFTDDGWKWEKTNLNSESEYGERYELLMEITPEQFYSLHKNKLQDIKIRSDLL